MNKKYLKIFFMKNVCKYSTYINFKTISNKYNKHKDFSNTCRHTYSTNTFIQQQ